MSHNLHICTQDFLIHTCIGYDAQAVFLKKCYGYYKHNSLLLVHTNYWEKTTYFKNILNVTFSFDCRLLYEFMLQIALKRTKYEYLMYCICSYEVQNEYFM